MSWKRSWMQWKNNHVRTDLSSLCWRGKKGSVLLCFAEAHSHGGDHDVCFPSVSSSMIELSVVESAVQDCTQSCDETTYVLDCSPEFPMLNYSKLKVVSLSYRDNVFNIIGAFDVPRYIYSVERKKFVPWVKGAVCWLCQQQHPKWCPLESFNCCSY